MEKIGIIIGRIGNPTYLEQCIESVLQQTSDRWELYLPKLSDNTGHKNIISKYEKNPSINFIHDSTGLSYAETLNKLIENSDCEIIGLLDGNDLLNEFCVEKILQTYEAFCKTGLVYTNFMIFGQDNKPVKVGDCIPIKPWQRVLDHKSFGPFLSFKKKDFNIIEKFSTELKHAEEIDIAYKLDDVTKHRFINEPLYFKRNLDESADHKTESLKQRNIKTARQNAFIRRGLPNTDNPLTKLFNMDYYSVKKLKYKKGKRIIDPVIGIENLASAKKILDKFNMNSWLMGGTLLGYYRDNKFIPHDCDLDIGCFFSEFNSEIFGELLKDGWEVERIFGKYEAGLEISLNRSNLKLDIFFFYEENGRYWYSAWKKTNRGWNSIRYYFDPFELKEIDYMGHKFNIPADTDKYITTKYGPSWNKMVKDWDWAYGPPNSVKTDYYL